MAIRTVRPLPVLIGHDYEHIMAKAIITEEPNRTSVTVTLEGKDAAYFAGFLTATEPIALSFVATPTQPRKHPQKEN